MRASSQVGLWLSLVERLVRDQEAVGSNPTSPIHCTISTEQSRKTALRLWQTHVPRSERATFLHSHVFFRSRLKSRPSIKTNPRHGCTGHLGRVLQPCRTSAAPDGHGLRILRPTKSDCLKQPKHRWPLPGYLHDQLLHQDRQC
jgi:hypothetical protein